MENSLGVLIFSLTCLNVLRVESSNATASSAAAAFPTNPNGEPPLPEDLADLGDLFTPAPLQGCPAKLKICWQDNPPYLMMKTANLTGVFKDVLDEVLKKCCESSGNGTLPTLEYEHEGSGQNCASAHLNLPIHMEKECSGKFVNFVQSPGIALVLNRKKLFRKAQKNVWVEIMQLWTVLLLALMLATISGIVIWTLDTFSNPKTFPPEFPRGATEGVWWAFVTMTTVGYGDKIPKSLCGRIFAVVWMFVGLSLMSFLTATMTSALTSGQVRNTADVFNKRIGVLENGKGYDEGIKQGANVERYKTLKELYGALTAEEVDGVMLDVFKASYSANHIVLEKDKQDLVMDKIFEFPFILGVCVSMEGLERHKQCIRDTSNAIFQSEAYHTVRKYVQGPTLKEASKPKSGWWQTELNLFSTESKFYLFLTVLGSILGALVFLGFVYEAFMCRRRASHTFSSSRSGDANYTRATEMQQLMENLNELEKSLAKLSEFKDLYHKLKNNLEYENKREKSRANNRAHTYLEMNSHNARFENYRTR